MRRIFGLVSVIILMLVLAACGDSEEKRTFESKEEGSESTVVYTHKGDKIINQTSKNSIVFAEIGLTSDEVKEIFDMMSEEYQGIDGVTHKVEYTDEEAIESLTVDFEKVDFDKLGFIPGLAYDEGDDKDNTSMEKHAKNLAEIGYTEVK